MGLFDKSTACCRHYQNSTLALRLEPFALSLFYKTVQMNYYDGTKTSQDGRPLPEERHNHGYI
jgi:hypothetical protein